MNKNIAHKLELAKQYVGRQKSKSAESLPLEGCEELASEMAEMSQAIKDLTSALKEKEKVLRSKAMGALWSAENTGQVIKTAEVETPSCCVTVTRKNQFKPLAPEFIEQVSSLIGKKIAAQLFEPTLELKVRKGQAEKMIEACEKAGVNLHEFCDVTQTHKPTSDFIERRAAYRNQMGTEKNQAFDLLTFDAEEEAGFLYSPSITYKTTKES